MNQGKITILVVDEPEHDRIGLEVEVTGTLTTAEVIGYMEMAKLQHLEGRRVYQGTVHTEQTPTEG